MKRYYLSINKGKAEVIVLDDSKKNFYKKLEKIKKENPNIQELIVDNEIREILSKKSKLKITQKDIAYFLQAIERKLGTNDLPDNIKGAFLKTYKENTKINPIFVLLFKSNKTVVDILSMLEFPNKNIIIEILKSQKENIQKYNDLKRVQEIQYMKNKMKAKIQKVSTFGVLMISFIIGIGLFFKFILAPKMQSFLGNIMKTLGTSGDSTLLITVAADYYFKAVIGIIIAAITIIILYFVNRKLFMAMVLRIPHIGDIIRKQNSINILMLYSFYNTNANEFYEKLKEMFPLIKLDFYWADLPELIEKAYKESKKQLYGAKLFDISIVNTIDDLSNVSNPDNQLKKEIDIYIDELESDIELVQSFIITTITIVIGVSVAIMFLSLMITMSGFPKKIQELQNQAGL